MNPATGVATPLGSTGLPPSPFKLDAINPDGTKNIADESLFVSGGKLYATFDAGTLDTSNGNTKQIIAPALYQLDVAAGTALRIGPTDFGIFSSIDVGGKIYSYGALDSGLVNIDPATGNFTFVTGIDPSVGFISGVTPVPEPRTTALLGLCLIAGAVWRRTGLLLHSRDHNLFKRMVDK